MLAFKLFTFSKMFKLEKVKLRKFAKLYEEEGERVEGGREQIFNIQRIVCSLTMIDMLQKALPVYSILEIFMRQGLVQYWRHNILSTGCTKYTDIFFVCLSFLIARYFVGLLNKYIIFV